MLRQNIRTTPLSNQIRTTGHSRRYVLIWHLSTLGRIFNIFVTLPVVVFNDHTFGQYTVQTFLNREVFWSSRFGSYIVFCGTRQFNVRPTLQSSFQTASR